MLIELDTATGWFILVKWTYKALSQTHFMSLKKKKKPEKIIHIYYWNQNCIHENEYN